MKPAIRLPMSTLLTHMHSDHCLELGPLLHTIWVSSPKRDIHLYGPQGTSRMVDDFFRVMSYDVSMRMQDEKQRDPRGMFLCTEFKEGLVFKDEYVEVTPSKIRLRKVLLKEHERKRANK